jgi:transcriptional regulator with XRE-family HTH domain
MYETEGGNAMTFGERMRKRRNEIGKTLAEIANEIGKTESTVQRYENDVIKSIGYDVVCALADALHTTPAYLVGWDEKSPLLLTRNGLLRILRCLTGSRRNSKRRL